MLLNAILHSLDGRLSPAAFTRRSSDHEWRGRLASGHAVALHLSFGKNTDPILVTVSVGIAHPPIESALQAAGYRPQGTARTLTFGRPLATLENRTSGRESPGNEIAAQVWRLWVDQGQPFLTEAAQLAPMAVALQSSEAQQWPCPSRSDRARLLPLTLWELGDRTSALASLQWLAEDLGEADQLRPAFSAFTAWLRNRASSAV